MRRPVRDKAVDVIAWRIDCNNDLTIIVAVLDKYILLQSKAAGASSATWRIGEYKDVEEAHRRAVEMTGSYERLRKGLVQDPHQIHLPADLWESSLANGVLNDTAGSVISNVLNSV